MLPEDRRTRLHIKAEKQTEEIKVTGSICRGHGAEIQSAATNLLNGSLRLTHLFNLCRQLKNQEASEHLKQRGTSIFLLISCYHQLPFQRAH